MPRIDNRRQKTNECACGCGAMTSGKYAQGHHLKQRNKDHSDALRQSALARFALPEFESEKAAYEYLFDLDSETGILTRRVGRGSAAPKGARVGTVDGKGYLHVNFDGRFIRLHRIIFLMHYGWCPPAIDHINCNKQDNRPENLRPATIQQNNGNIYPPRHNTSGIKGVSRNSRSGLWHAQIKIFGKQTCLGRFETKEEAAKVYAEAARKHFGEYARTSEDES